MNKFFDQEWKKLKKLPAQERVVRGIMGQERRFSGRPTGEVERQCHVTWPHQIEASQVKKATSRLDRIFRRQNMKACILMTIHDALWVESTEAEAEEVRAILQAVMTTPGRLDVPLEVDID